MMDFLHENVEGRMKGKSTRGRKKFKCYTIWQNDGGFLNKTGS